MAWRPEWYQGDEGRRSPFDFGAWSASKLVILLTVAMFVVQVLVAKLASFDVMRWFGLSRETAIRVYPLLTYMFLHDTGSLWHIALNMLTVWMFGRDVEAQVGPRRFLALYFGAGLIGGLAHIASSSVPVIGASGGCLGVLTYFGFAFPDRQIVFLIFPLRAKTLVLLFIGADLFRGLQSADGVAHLAHLGGAAFGYLFWRYQWDPVPRLGSWSRRFRDWQQRREHEERERKQAEVDRILKKIYDQGMPSLTEKERRFMEQASRELRNRN